jgi:predicted ATP-grasp superfamily ATP-dependent carboligase
VHVTKGANRRHGESADALVLDARQRQALVCVRALGRSGLRVGAVETSANAPAFVSRWCRTRAVVPDFTRNPEAYVQALLELLGRYRPRVLIPVHDGSIEAVRAHRRVFEDRVALALAGEKALQVAVNKTATLAIAAELGLAVPRGVVVEDTSEVRPALREIGYPAVVKPVQSWIERNGVGTRVACQAVLNEEEAKRVVGNIVAAGGSVVVQEWLNGRREAINLFYARGRIWARFAQVAHRMYPPLGSASVLRESVALPPDATDHAERLIRAIDLEGYSEVEFRRDRAGRPVLMEVNPRLSASVEIAVRAGVNFPALLFAWAAGEALQEVPGYRHGLRVRWLGGDLAHLRATLSGQGRPDVAPVPRAVSTFLLDFLRPTAYDYLDLRDLRPAIVASWSMVRGVLGQEVARCSTSFGQRKKEAFRQWHPRPR